MRGHIKEVLRTLRLGPSVRGLRRWGWWIVDAIGGIYFALLRLTSCKRIERSRIAKILIIRIDRIGDLILSTPAIKAVRNTFPDAQIHLLVSEYAKDLVMHNPDLNKVLIHKKDVVAGNYDLAIALHPGMLQNRLAFRSGAEWRVGYTGWGGGFFLTHKLKDDRAVRVRHEVESALKVVKEAGCEIKDKKLEISVTEEGESFAEDFFKKNILMNSDLIITIHPGARQEYIKWRKEGFAGVADGLIKQNAKVILVGGKEEKQLLEETGSLMKGKPLFATGLRLTQLISLIKRSDLFIGNSTGPMHIAAALKVPVVAVFGPVHPLDSYKEWGPWGEGHTVVSKDLDCPECHPTDCKTFDCMRLITVEDVMKAVRVQLGKIKELSVKG